MRSFLPLLTALIGLVVTSPVAGAQSRLPDITNTSIAPVQTPYPPANLAPTQGKAAFTTAGRTHRRVLLDFGGNWCPDCRILAGIFAVSAVDQWLEEHFVIVPVNVGHLDTNMELAEHYGVTIKAIPTVLILTPEGRLLNADGALALGSARRMAPQSVITLLNDWSQRPSKTHFARDGWRGRLELATRTSLPFRT